MLVNENEGHKFLDDVRAGRVKLGLGIDCDLDNYLRFKRDNFNIIAGHANVGKTLWVLYYYLCIAEKHGLRFLFYSAENAVRSMKRDLIQLSGKVKLEDLPEMKYLANRQWVDYHFQFVDHEGFYLKKNRSMSHLDLLDVLSKSDSDGLVLDPWNSLHVDEGRNSHQADYKAATDIRMFCKTERKNITILAHGVTEALRKVHGKEHEFAGHTRPLMPADQEGGGKWNNRVDDYINLHRYTQHPTEWMYTDVHVRKVKETATGGKPTFIDCPVRFKLEKGLYFTVDGFNPLEKKNEPQQMQVLDNSTLNSKSWYEVDKEEEDPFNDDEDELMKMINI